MSSSTKSVHTIDATTVTGFLASTEKFVQKHALAIVGILFIAGSRVPIKPDPGISRFFKSNIGSHLYYMAYGYVFTTSIWWAFVISIMALDILPYIFRDFESDNPEIPDASKKAAKVAAKAVVRVIDEAQKTASALAENTENFADTSVEKGLHLDPRRREVLPQSDPRVGYRVPACKTDGKDDRGSRPQCYGLYPGIPEPLTGADSVPLGIGGNYLLAADLIDVPGYPKELL